MGIYLSFLGFEWAQRLPLSGNRDVYAMPGNSRASQASLLLQKIAEEVGRPSTVIPAQAGTQGKGGSRPAPTAKNLDTRLHGHDCGLTEVFAIISAATFGFA